MRAGIFCSIFLGIFALAATALTVPAAAQPSRGYERQGVQPLDRLLPGIRRSHPGNFYDAEGPTYGPGGDAHYHLKWLTPDGRVIWYDADARNGRVLRSSPGRDSFDTRSNEGPPPPGYAQPYTGRYPPYTADPYDGGYGRARERERFDSGPPHGYGRSFGGRGDGGRGDGGGRGGRGGNGRGRR